MLYLCSYLLPKYREYGKYNLRGEDLLYELVCRHFRMVLSFLEEFVHNKGNLCRKILPIFKHKYVLLVMTTQNYENWLKNIHKYFYKRIKFVEK